jgi:predicted small metal-binding protein
MKTYNLSCKDMGVVGCDYVATGANKEEVISMAQDHGMKVHTKEMNESAQKMSKEEMMVMMSKAVKEEET